jgi:hypothetical protein
MSKSSWSFEKILFTVALIIGLGFILQSTGLFAGIFSGCDEGNSFTGCSGEDSIVQVCKSGIWQTVNETKALPSQSCFEGKIISKTCTQDTNTCLNSYTVLQSNCESSKPVLTKVICPTGQYCNNGACVIFPSTCGNNVCDSGESQDNCYLDCGSLSSWDEYYLSIPEAVKKDALWCGGVYDCDSAIVAEAVADMENKYHPTTPKQWIDSASKYVYGLGTYRLDGGQAQCGEKASDLLTRALHPVYGQTLFINCVDYSLLFSTMAKYKKMPAYTSGNCLKNSRNWQCTTFAFVGNPAPNLEPLGYINGLPKELGGQQYGHSISYIWNPLVNGFSIVDPIFQGTTISKSCVGYSESLISGGTYSHQNQVCYIPIEDAGFCSNF